MTEEKQETAKKQKEELIDTAIRVLKKDHNWKIFIGILIGWLLAVYI